MDLNFQGLDRLVQLAAAGRALAGDNESTLALFVDAGIPLLSTLLGGGIVIAANWYTELRADKRKLSESLFGVMSVTRQLCNNAIAVHGALQQMQEQAKQYPKHEQWRMIQSVAGLEPTRGLTDTETASLLRCDEADLCNLLHQLRARWVALEDNLEDYSQTRNRYLAATDEGANFTYENGRKIGLAVPETQGHPHYPLSLEARASAHQLFAIAEDTMAVTAEVLGCCNDRFKAIWKRYRLPRPVPHLGSAPPPNKGEE
ncbi:hypothetical protein [Maricaulis sp.]|uniref:hypothetical protein n=1 Tax=Maricaulis sp. TaxID=1486257 RepID=UPI0032971FCE